MAGRKNVSEELESMRNYRDLNYTPPNSTDSLPAWELCRSWIDNCFENHGACKSLHSSPGSQWWPTRLLYVGSNSDSDSNLGNEDFGSLNIQLRLTQNKPLVGSYMTLSHCWGVSGEMLKLTVDTYEHRIKNGFSYAELPKTFQDVVRLSRFLRNEYIWIDSLCIIQGSTDDWIRESKMMASVYQHSKCNIAATASRGPTEGCFYSRNPAVVSPLKIKSQYFGSYIFLDDETWRNNVENAPLNKRAWVMQERAFTPRQIHCGRDQLLWECHQTTACETFPFILDFENELLTEFVNPKSLGSRLSELSRLRCSKIEDRPFPNTDESITHLRHDIYQYWTRIIEAYSSCELTNRTDRLVAIFGIASRIQDTLEDTDKHIAGLWRSQLPWQLLWFTRRNKQDDALYDTALSYSTGPSWSWTSLNTAVSWWGYNSGQPMLIDILDVHDGHTITGQANFDGTRESPLTLRCLLYKIHVFKGKDPYILTGTQKHGEARSVTLGGSKITLNEERIHMDNIESRNFWEQSYLMPVTRDKMGIFSCIFVSPCQEKPRFYRRIAFACSYHMKGEGKTQREIDTLADGDKVTITLI